MSADRRKYPGPDRRKNGGKVFKNSEQIQREKEFALEKLEQYERDENVGIKVLVTFSTAAIFIVVALAGLVHGYNKWVLFGVIGAIASLVVGEITISFAKKAARKSFKDENLHLVKYV